MRSASVGFQCPSCVKEGARSVRTAKLPYGGARVANPTLVTMILLGINVAVWLAITADGGTGSGLATTLGITPNYTFRFDEGGAILVDGVAHGAWWQVITSVFTHVQVFHIALNMIALYMFGPPLEQILGRVRFLTLYVVSGVTGSAGVMLFSGAYGSTVGASGAIFGLLGAMAVIAFKTGGAYQDLLSLLGLNLVITFTIPHISWQGHLGGLLGGVLVALAMVYAPRRGRTLVQLGSAAALLAVAVGLIVVRANDLKDQDLPAAPYPQVSASSPHLGTTLWRTTRV
ncbi:MAG: rhomboid family intramembrane serine protease [Nocardioidaceae bacterium]|nr:rhomboid family intramembrane serine protease [Nocardioidaceae bacterium]